MTSKRLTRHCHAMRHNQSNLIFSLLGAQCFKTGRKMSHFKVCRYFEVWQFFPIFFFLVEKDETFFKNYFQIFVLLFAHYESSFLKYVGHIIISGPKITFYFKDPLHLHWWWIFLTFSTFPTTFGSYKKKLLDTYFWTNEQMCHLTCFHIF